MIRLFALALLVAASVICLAQSVPLKEGSNVVSVRGIPQDVYYIAGQDGSRQRPSVLFAPGDGGWRGFALTLAQQVSSWGYDVYGLDTKRYLESFTGATTLNEGDVMRDIRTLADAVRGKGRVVLLGWSAGAGLLALAAAAESKPAYSGLITMGLGNSNVLGWRFADNLTYVTRKKPDEPTFSALPHMSKIAPLPIVMIQSSHDEYVPRNEAIRLFTAAAEPKRFVQVEAQNHRFDGAQSQFFQQLKEALEWITTKSLKSKPDE